MMKSQTKRTGKVTETETVVMMLMTMLITMMTMMMTMIQMMMTMMNRDGGLA